MAIFKQKIFREYDIRGVYNEDYNAEFATLIGRTVAQYLKLKVKPRNNRTNFKFAVGRDARPSGKILSTNFSEALLSSGVEVLDLGIVPTPMVYYSTHHLDIDGAVSITGSHNPSEYNGFKICVGQSTLHGREIQDLFKICSEFSKTQSSTSNQTSALKITPTNILDDYIKDLTSRIKLGRKLKVVIDSGNGTGAVVAPKLLKSLGLDVIELFCELDGTFPNHHPDPTVLENLKDLQACVSKEKADLGIAYDGDADRIGAVDENGKPIYGDELMVLYSREILSRKPGAKIISEVKSSHKLYQDIEKHGGKAIMWKTGHSLIKAKMKEEKAELAGEMSGHMFFSDRYYGYDDAVYASLRLLEIVSNQQKPLSSLLLDLPKTVSTPELRVDCPDEIKFKVVEEVKNEFKKTHRIIDIDGVRIETNTGWGLLRASNTQPSVVMRFEANTENELEQLKELVETAFERVKKKFI